MTDAVEISELTAFVTIVDAKSLSRAAAQLGQPRATIGRRLARLEDRLGVRLLRRTTRSSHLTDAGQAFYRHARIAIEAVDSAVASVHNASEVIRGDVRVSMPPIHSTSFNAMVVAFMAKHPEVRLQIDKSAQYVDLQRGGYDFAIRAASVFEPGLILRTLGRTTMIGVAAPAYIAEHGKPKTVRDLTKHRCLQTFARGEMPQTMWPLKNGKRVAVPGVFSSNDLQMVLQLTLAGVGIALLPDGFVQGFINAGRLERVLSGTLEAQSRFGIVFREREFMPSAVRAFLEATTAWMESGASFRESVPDDADVLGLPLRQAMRRRSEKLR